MTESYAVSARLTMTSNVPEMLGQMQKGFGELNKLIADTQKLLSKFGGKGLAELQATLTKLGETKIGGSLLTDMEKLAGFGKEMADAQKMMATTAKEAAAAYKQLAELSAKVKIPAPPGAVPGRPGAPSGRGAANHTDYVNAGMSAGMAGDAGMSFIERSVMAAAEVGDILNNLAMNTKIKADPGMLARIRKSAEEMVRSVPGSTVAENLHTINDAFTALGSITEAINGAPAMARMEQVLRGLPGADGKRGGNLAYAAAQAVEVMQRIYNPQTHEIDMEQFNKQIAAMTQVAVGTGGRVTPDAYLAFAKQARMGGMLADDSFLYRDLPAIINALGGARAGTGDAAVYRQFAQGRMTKAASEELKKIGILDQSAKWSGGRVQDIDKHLEGFQTFQANPVQWVREYLDKELAAHGVDPKDPKQAGNAAGKFAATNVGLGFLGETILGILAIEKEGGKIGDTTPDPFKQQQESPLQKIREFNAAQNEFMVTLGSALMGPAIESLKSMTAALREMSDWAKEHPNASKDILVAAAGLSVLAKAAGELAMVVFIGSPLLAGLAGLTKAIGSMVKKLPATSGVPVPGAPPGSPVPPGVAAPATAVAATVAGWASAIIGLAGAVAGQAAVISDLQRHGTNAQGGINQGFSDPSAPVGLPGDSFDSGQPNRGRATSLLPPIQSFFDRLYHAINDAPPKPSTGVITLDGKAMGSFVMGQLDKQLNRPQGGMTGFDFKMSPYGNGALA